MAVLKYYAPADSSRHAAGNAASQQTARSLHSEKRATWLPRQLSTRSAPVEGNHRWSLASLSNRRHSEQLERRKGARHVVEERRHDLQQVKPGDHGKPALFLTIPEDSRPSNVPVRCRIEEAALDESARYSPVASSPFVTFPPSEEHQPPLTGPGSMRSCATSSPNISTVLNPPQDEYGSARVSDEPRGYADAAGYGAPYRQLHAARFAASSRGSCDMYTKSTMGFDKPLPALPSLPSEEQQPSVSTTSAVDFSYCPFEHIIEAEAGLEVALWEEKQLVPAATTATLSRPFSTFDPTFMAYSSESDASDDASLCSSVDPPIRCSSEKTSISEPPPIPQRSNKRPVMPLTAQQPAFASEAIPPTEHYGPLSILTQERSILEDIAQEDDASEPDLEAVERDLIAQLVSVASAIDGMRASDVCKHSIQGAEGTNATQVAVA